MLSPKASLCILGLLFYQENKNDFAAFVVTISSKKMWISSTYDMPPNLENQTKLEHHFVSGSISFHSQVSEIVCCDF
jgi:hypothetical protein